MFDIGKYLEKFKILGNSRFFLRDTVKDSIKEICGIDIDPKDIFIKEGLARISTKPIIKNEIFLKKQKILESINTKSEQKILDIL